jgi:hypothetical protein
MAHRVGQDGRFIATLLASVAPAALFCFFLHLNLSVCPYAYALLSHFLVH